MAYHLSDAALDVLHGGCIAYHLSYTALDGWHRKVLPCIVTPESCCAVRVRQ